MSRHHLPLAPLLAAAVAAAAARGQDAPSADPVEMDVTSRVEAVTVYRGQAAATRRATVTLAPGVYALRFTDLPAALHPETLQARVAPGLGILAVEYEQLPATAETSPALAALDDGIRRVRDEIAEADGRLEIVRTQEQFVERLGVRATDDATADGGTDQLDLDVIREQLAFIADERTRLLGERRTLEATVADLARRLAALEARREDLATGSPMVRSGVVTVAAPEPVEGDIRLTYLVDQAEWAPVYNIRSATDGTAVSLEYDAMLAQRSGEDWRDVELTLSTARPTLAAHPPRLDPWFVDAIDPDAPGPPPRAAAVMVDETTRGALERLSAAAEVGGAGPSVTFTLPRRVTVRTDAAKRQRSRIATIDTAPQFVHMAVPMLTEAVYIRGELTNASDFQLLPGRASIFVGSDYVGPTDLRSVPPRGRFEVFFGIDEAVRVTRQIVRKQTSKTGLLAGGRETTYEFRVLIDNGTGKGLELELWDRHPVSRHEKIQIEVVNLSLPLATDPRYLEDQRPQGLLKWILPVPPTSRGPAALPVTWGVHVNRDKDVLMTPLPE
ncbi:MAG: mucoidy inhibitor MuiA family protein [Planctomycetota bacterium]|jgi:uncharacterized protein (TIGR02231 family)